MFFFRLSPSYLRKGYVVSRLYFRSFLAVLAFLSLMLPFPASADEEPGKAPSHANKVSFVLSCFTIHPLDLPKGEQPRSCDSYCMEKLAVCTGVQSDRGPPPACEDGLFKDSGHCRCCKVQ